jgi:hypothetical protein
MPEMNMIFQCCLVTFESSMRDSISAPFVPAFVIRSPWSGVFASSRTASLCNGQSDVKFLVRLRIVSHVPTVPFEKGAVLRPCHNFLIC